MDYLDSGVTAQEKGGGSGKGQGAVSEGDRQAGGRGDNGRGGPAQELDGRRKGSRAEKISGPLGGDVPGYGTDRRRRGGRMDADPFIYLLYPERTERRVGIGVEGYDSGKCGCRGLPRDQIDGENLHAEIRRV